MAKKPQKKPLKQNAAKAKSAKKSAATPKKSTNKQTAKSTKKEVKPSKKSPPQKANAPKKISAVSNKPAKVTQTKNIPVVEVPRVAEFPTRAPVRKIVGLGITPRIVPQVTLQEPTVIPTPPLPVHVPTAVETPVVVTAAPIPSLPKLSWSKLPHGFPPHIKFLMSTAERECQEIGEYPFPFAKFIRALPKEVCGLEFGLSLLSLEHSREAIAKLCSMDLSKVDHILDSAEVTITGRFSELCSELDRKLNVYRGRSDRSVESVMEPYLISKVDRNLQLLVGALLLR